MSGLRYSNASIPKYIHGEPLSHKEAKLRVREILEAHAYDVQTDPEHVIVVPEHKGFVDMRFPVDVYASSKALPDTDIIVAQIDGEYHRSSLIQKGRTQNRDDTLGKYCSQHGIRYVVFNHPNVVQDIIDRRNGYSDCQIATKLGLEIF